MNCDVELMFEAINHNKGCGIEELKRWDFGNFRFSEHLSKKESSDFFNTDKKILALEDSLSAVDMTHTDRFNEVTKRLTILRTNKNEAFEAIVKCFGSSYAHDCNFIKDVNREICSLEKIENEEREKSIAEVAVKTNITRRIACLHRAKRHFEEEHKLSGNGITVSRKQLKTVRDISQEIVSDSFSADIDRRQMKVSSGIYKDMLRYRKTVLG